MAFHFYAPKRLHGNVERDSMQSVRTREGGSSFVRGRAADKCSVGQTTVARYSIRVLGLNLHYRKKNKIIQIVHRSVF